MSSFPTLRLATRRATTVAASMIFSALAATALADDAFDLRTVATSGDPAPGSGGEVFTRFFLNPRIDAAGRTAFYADLAGREICVDGTGIWSERGGTLELVALEGEPAPGTPDVFRNLCGTAFNPLNLGMDADGHVTFRTELAGPDIEDCNLNGFPENDSAWYTTLGGGGALRLAVREDDPAPEQPSGHTFDDLPSPKAGLPGIVGHSFGLKSGTCPEFGPAPFTGYVDTGTGFETFVEPGEPGPLPDTTIATRGTGIKFTPDDAGVFGYNVALDGPGIDASNDLVFVLDDHGTRTVKVRESQAAPDVRPGLRISLGFGNAGTLSSRAGLRGDVHAFVTELFDVDTDERVHASAAYVARADGVLRFVAKSDDPAPGIPGGRFSSVGLSNVPLAAADGGRVVFHSFVTGDGVTIENNETVHRFDGDGRIGLVAREGEELPDRPGVFFGKDQTLFETSFGPAAITRDGHFAFLVGVHGAGLDGTEANALMFRDDRTGTLRTVVATGDTVEVGGDPGDARTVRRVSSFYGTELASMNFNGPAINEDETVVFALRFEDDSGGVFTARFVHDADADGVRDTDDVCPTVFDPDQDDLDGDLRGDLCDCAPDDPGAFREPEEVRDVAWLSATRMVWESQLRLAGPGTTYDAVREAVEAAPVGSASGAACVEDGVGEAQAEIAETPAPGAGFRYLVRAVNGCGAGSLGESSAGAPRVLEVCP